MAFQVFAASLAIWRPQFARFRALSSRRTGPRSISAAILAFALGVVCAASAGAQQLQTLRNEVRPQVANGQAALAGAMPLDQTIRASIVLPLRNTAELNALLGRLYDPSSPDYRHFLTVDQFTAEFGPTNDDFQAVVAFAQANGLTVDTLPANRLVVPVAGTVAQINAAFHVRMNLYQHPTENRTFFSPDREPSLNLSVPVANIGGLDSFSLPRPMYVRKPGSVQANAVTGSGPGGSYLGSDMRAAYYGGSTLDGSGQAVGLLEFGGYNLSDVNLSFSNAGQTYGVPVNNVLLDGATGAPNGDDAEEVLDIVQAIGMAPNLSQVRVYIGGGNQTIDDANVLNSIASENIAKQISSSWSWRPADPTADDPFFLEMATQGQTFFTASGDDGAYDAAISPFFYPAEDQNVTAVGGTHLTTGGAGGGWVSESVWNSSGGGSGGGISPDGVAIPSWQVGLATTVNGGSTTLRNVPDVAMEGDFDNYACSLGSCSGGYAGTSFAAPRWAGFMALVNQQAVEAGNAPSGGLGFLNTALYRLAQATASSGDFHDVTVGNNDTNNQPLWFNAEVGYDLTTGWGSANGQHLIDDLAGPQVPGFWIASSQSTIGVNPGGTASSAFKVSDAGGFTGSVTFAVSSALPTGVTASFSPNPATSSSVLTLTATGSAPNATQIVTVTGTSGTLTASSQVTVAVHAASFTLAASPATVGINQGASGTSIVKVQPLYGFTGTVALSIAGLPSGVTAAFSPASTAGTSTLTLTASSTATPGNSNLTITGVSGSLTETATVALSIHGPSFTLLTSPTVAVGQGSTGSSYIFVEDQYGFTGSVNLTVSGLPTGVTASFSPNPTTGTSTLTFTASNSAPAGQSVVTVTGTSGALTATTTIALGVYAPSFTIAGSSNINIGQGSSGTGYLYVTPQYGFTGSVTFSIAGLPAGVTALWTPNPTTNTSNLTLSASSSAKAGQYNLTVTGTSGSITATAQLTVGVYTPTFTVSTYSSVTIGQGSSSTAYVYVTPQYGFTGSVNLSLSGLPAGVTGSFSPNPATGTSTLTLQAASAATVGQYNVTITGTSGTQTATATLAVGVYVPTFTLQNYGGVTVGQGTSSTGYVYVNAQYGFTGSVNLSVSGLPSGVTASFSPNPTTGQSAITVNAASNAAAGQYNVIVTGTSGSQTATTTLTLGVYKPTFTLSSGGSVTIGQGTTANSYVYVSGQYGFTGSVNLSVSGLPAGVTASFSPNPTTGTSNLTLTASSTATLGQYTLTITGTSGTATAATNLTLGVYVPTFTLSGPYSLTAGQGSTNTEYVYANAQYGFTGGVSLSVSGLPAGVTATFSPNPTTYNSLLTLNVAASAPLGTSTVAVTGTSGALTQTVTFPLTIVAPSFTVYSNLSTLSLNQGASGTDFVSIYGQNGFAGSVTFSASGLPAGVTATFSPNPTTYSSTLTLTASSSAAPGAVNVTITGTSGTVTASTTLGLTVNAPGFTLASAPAEVFLLPGGTGKTTLSAVDQNGFTGNVTYTVSGLPAGVTGSFSPNPSSTSSVLTLTASSTASPGNATATITGTSGSLTATASLPVTIRSAPSATTVALAISSGGKTVTTVAAGTPVDLTATVTAGSTTVTAGQVDFCTATGPYCDPVHLVGTVQITSKGIAVLQFLPGPGDTSYDAIFSGTNAYAGAASGPSSLAVTSAIASKTAISQSGAAGNYTLSATVGGNGPIAPSGTVNFLDSTNGNVALGSAKLTAGTPIFSLNTAQSPSVDSNPYSVATGDFNGDGIPDFAVTSNSYSANIVDIRLGNGDGTFKSAASLQTGGTPSVVVAGDFNRDGKLDLAITLQSNSSINIFLGNGDGTFSASPSSPQTGSGPSGMSVADFDGDGLLDLAVVNANDQTVSVLLGHGDGTFAPAGASPSLGSSASGIVRGDFNADGIQDLAVLSDSYNGSVHILLGAGDGTFSIAGTLSVGEYSNAIATSDFNGDGKPDLAVPNVYGGTVSILLGNGDGTFAAATAASAGSYPATVAVGDFNGDGKPDLAVAGSYSSSLLVLLGNGDGTFGPATTASAGNSPASLAVADWNGDGLADLVVANGGSSILTVLTSQLAQTATGSATGISPLGTGQHAVDATFVADTHYAASTSATISLTAQSGPPAVTLTLSAASIDTAQPLTVTAAVSGGTGNPIPTGSVKLTSGSYSSSPATLSGGSASITIPAGSLSIGTDTLTAAYTPDAASSSVYTAASGTASVAVARTIPTITWATPSAISYGTALGAAQLNATASTAGTFVYVPAAGTVLPVGTQTLNVTFTPTDSTDYASATGTVVLTVTPASTATTFSLSNNNLTFTATVAPANGGTPTGTVTFLAGSTPLGTGTLANGVASYTAASFPAGDVTLSAQYGGDVNFAKSTSTAIPALTVTLGTATVSVGVAATVSDALTFAVVPGYSGTLNLSCANLPQYAACTFAPSSVAFTGTANSATSTLTIATGTKASLSFPAAPFANPQAPARNVAWAALLGLSALLLSPKRRRKLRAALSVLVLLLVVGVSASSLTGCGGGSSGSGGGGGSTSTPAGTYTVQIVANGPAGLTQSTNLTVTVQ